MANTIGLEFADGKYTFALPLARIDELQRKTNIGIGGLFARLTKGCFQVGAQVMVDPANAEFYVLDIVETLRQGLIGGNHGLVNGEEIKISPALAERLITNYVLDRPLAESWSLAVSVLGACIVGYEPEGNKKKDPDHSQEITPTAD